MTGIDELLRQAAADAPPDDLDPQDLLARGHGRLRQRRLRVVAAVVASVAVLTAVPLAARLAGSRDADPADRGPSVDLANATSDEVGRDWMSLSRLTIGDLRDGERTRRLAVLGLLPDGRAVVGRVDSRSDVTRVGLLDPGLDPRWLPRRTAGAYLGADGDHLVFGVAAAEGGGSLPTDPGYQVFDIAAGTWQALPPNADVDASWPGSIQSQQVSEGWLYVEVAPVDQPTGRLWRVPVDGSGQWQNLGVDVVRFSVSGPTLTYTTTVRGGHVVRRDLDTGRERRLPLQAPDRCAVNDLATSSAVVVLGFRCTTPEADDGTSQRLVVLDRRGRVQRSVESARLQVTLVTDDLVGFSVLDGIADDSDAKLVGVYLLRPETGRLLRLSRHALERPPGTTTTLPLAVLRQDGPQVAGPDRTVLLEAVRPR